MKVLVCGGRNYHDIFTVFRVLDVIDYQLGVEEVIEGDAPGADRAAAKWARQRGKKLTTFPADWGQHGKAAGPIRNQQMLDEGRPDAVVYFPGGKGTADMVARARRAGLHPIEALKKVVSQQE